MALGTGSPSGNLNGTLTVAASGGIATFNTLTIGKAASGYTLTATDTGLTGTTSSSKGADGGRGFRAEVA